MVYQFERVSDNKVVALDITEYHKSPADNIVAFEYGGHHYHIHAHGSSTNHHAIAKQIAAKGGTAIAGVKIGSHYGKSLGPAGTIVGGVTGGVVAIAGEIAMEHLFGHSGDMSYIDELGNEALWGPVKA